MSIAEESRNDLYQGLVETLGKQRATTLMEHLPPGGWTNMATKQDLREFRSELRAEFAEFRGEVRAEFAEFRGELRAEFAEFRGEVRTELHKLLRVHTLAVVVIVATLMTLFGGALRLLG